MAHFDRSERGGRQGHWRRRQHRWNGPDHFHNDNRGPVFQQFDGLGGPGSFRLGPRPLPPVGRADSQQGVLDQLALRHMAQDCSSVKNQLLKLKSLLQMEDGCVVPDLVEDSEDNTALQLEDLMKEVRVLRDELKMKNRTIAQLTTQQQQLQQQQQANAHIHPGRCLCHQRAASTRADRRTRYDKSTQTPWRGHGHAPPVLQPSSRCLSEQLLQGRLARTAPTGGRSDPQPAARDTDSAPPPPPPPEPDPDELSLLLSTQLHLHDRARSGCSPASGAPSGLQKDQRAPRETTAGSSYPRILQPPRLHKRVSVPALPQGGGSGSSLRPGSAGLLVNPRTKQLPPPSRGLPCFNTGPQALGPYLGRVPPPQPRPLLGLRREDDPRLDGADQAHLPAKVPPSLSLSRLPKPKIH